MGKAAVITVYTAMHPAQRLLVLEGASTMIPASLCGRCIGPVLI